MLWCSFAGREISKEEGGLPLTPSSTVVVSVLELLLTLKGLLQKFLEFSWCSWVLVDVLTRFICCFGVMFVWGFGLESSFYGLAAVVLVLGLVFSAFLVPMVYTWSEVCSACGGDGVHSCRTCHGSGVCWVCEGTGRVWYMPGDGWCAACSGTGRCYTCGGTGVQTCETCYGRGSIGYWMFNVFGSSVVLSILDVFIFLGLFVVDFIFNEFYLGFNTWVYEVKDMGFWFNRSFWVWLFATDRKRWVKWVSGFGAFGAVYVGALTFWLF
jgi:hypothetical protein